MRCAGYDLPVEPLPRIDLVALQHAVAQWVTHNFGEPSRVEDALGLAEETGELCRAVLKQQQEVRGTHAEWQDEIEKELGDVVIKALSVAQTCGVDLNAAVHNRWEVIRLRDFRADPIGHGIPDTEGHS